MYKIYGFYVGLNKAYFFGIFRFWFVETRTTDVTLITFFYG